MAEVDLIINSSHQGRRGCDAASREVLSAACVCHQLCWRCIDELNHLSITSLVTLAASANQYPSGSRITMEE